MSKKNKTWYLKYFKEQDNEDNYEWPMEFSIADAENSFYRMLEIFAKTWQSKLDQDLHFFIGIKDASYHGVIIVPEKYYENTDLQTESVKIIFSNFGKLVIIKDDTHVLQPEMCKKIIEILEENNYIYVDREIVNLSYNGNCHAIKNKELPMETWEDRFFGFN